MEYDATFAGLEPEDPHRALRGFETDDDR